MTRWIALTFLLLSASLARAHPHVFVDVGLRFETDAQGQLVAVEVTWSYDEFFSLLVLSDRGLDADADMVLTEDERAALMGFDLTDWPTGFEGALFVHEGAGKLSLGPPEALSADMRDGRIVTRHRRPLVDPVIPVTLTVQPYDPGYYAALSLPELPQLPEGCSAEIIRPDTEAADDKVAELGGAGNEGLFDEVELGIYYADTLVITCARS